jgi:hypothetical protein
MRKGTKFMHLTKVEAVTRGPLSDQLKGGKLPKIDPTMSCLDHETQTELRKLLPSLLWVSRAWHARFLVKGCLACHKKDVQYVSGGMCASCVGANRQWIKNYIKTATANRETVEEIAKLSLRFDTAQALLNSDD